jgi:NAD(P)-dependent dehydrogenase (short-subunit alcohol dehydrogenase family)
VWPKGENGVREFDGKVAFVTGGASGLGFSLARAFGRANMRVMLADIEVGALNAAVAELKGAGIDARGVECDVANRASVEHAASDTLAAFGKIHVLCNNAGVVAGGPMERITPGDWDWVIGVELMGAVYGIQAFLPHLKAQGEGGHVVTVASMAGMLGVPGMGAHVAAKFGLVGLSETLAAELAGTSIGVSVLCCSFMRTRMDNSARNRSERYGPRTETSPEAEADLATFVRLGKDPEDVAEKVMRVIKENEMYIFTDPELRSPLEERFQRILAAYRQP